MSRAISIFGLGYVGTVTAACLAHQGNRVIGVDLSAAKVEALKTGRSPIVEPGVADLISGSRQASRLDATNDAKKAVLDTEISFLCVGTPSMRNGKLDLGHIGPVCQEIGEALRKKDTFHLVVLRSTVLPGTAETLVVPTLEKASGEKDGQRFWGVREPRIHARRYGGSGLSTARNYRHRRGGFGAQSDSPAGVCQRAGQVSNLIPLRRNGEVRLQRVACSEDLICQRSRNHGEGTGVDAEAVIEISPPTPS